MSTTFSAPVATLHDLAHAAGLTLTAVEPGTDFTGAPTDRYIAALTADPSKNQATERMLGSATAAENRPPTTELRVGTA